jgi:LysM repeat protein
MQTYTVQRGDSLFTIAQKFYGDGDKYRQLALYNQIRNPNALEIGQILKIPPVEELSSATNPLSAWHNYGDGTIYWRVTAKGVEIQGKGLVKDSKYTRQAADIWKKYQQPILTASQKYGVPVAVLIATISTESSGDPKSYRYEPAFYDRYIKDNALWKENAFYQFPKRIAASYGLMQIMYTTAFSAGFQGKPEDLYDPAANIAVSAAYIASPFQQKQHEWDPPKIACAYNAGSVRPTKQNAWGMFCYPGHLDRWIPSYNGAIEVTGIEKVPIPPAPDVVTPPPITVPKPPISSAQSSSGVSRATLRLLFPKAKGTVWKPVIIDVFKHGDNGISEPVSYTIKSPTVDPAIGYTYDIAGVETGVYDFVFSDAVSGSILYDIANYVVGAKLEVLDLRRNLSTTQGYRAVTEEQQRRGFVAWLKTILWKIGGKSEHEE